MTTLTRPWTLHILRVLASSGPTRFGVLRRSVDGISARVLTERARSAKLGMNSGVLPGSGRRKTPPKKLLLFARLFGDIPTWGGPP